MNCTQKPLGPDLTRRQFVKTTALLGAGFTAWGRAPAVLAAESPNETVVVAVMGLGRGLDLARAAVSLPNVELAYVCDVDQNRVAAALKALDGKTVKPPQGATDFRRMLDDRRVDAVFIATCNHWHAPATILACAAGKHVYVEKPGSHNAREGELMVAAARQHNRVVQLGTQRRSFPGTIEGITRLREGAIGKVTYARSWYTGARPSIGRGQLVPVPSNLDYSLWQGPAPERPYKSNLIPYNWHWHWHWGGGELANNGPHYLDLARWGLGVDYPLRVTCNGGRYAYQDDQETPDTGVVVFDFGPCGVSWEHSSCHPRKTEPFPLISFYGDQGTLSLDGGGYTIYDADGKQVARGSQPGGDQVHVANFLAGIRTGAPLNAPIAEGQKSTLLCHLGNIAYRTGHTVHFDPATRQIMEDPAAAALWGREYRPGWEPTV